MDTENEDDLPLSRVKIEMEDVKYKTIQGIQEKIDIETEIKQETPIEIEDYDVIPTVKKEYPSSSEESQESVVLGIPKTYEDTDEKNPKRRRRRRTREKQYKCDLCGKSYLVLSYYKRHLETAHIKKPTLNPDFQCKICNGFCDSTIGLQNHLFENHLEKFICSLCTFTYSTMEGLQNHRKEYHSGHSFSDVEKDCHVCEMKFREVKDLLSHIERFHGMMCGVCHESFPIRTKLFEHLHEKHQFEENSIQIKDECISEEEEEKPLSEVFNITTKIKVSKVKENVKPYECHLCGTFYQDPIYLKHHEESVHSTKPIINPDFQCKFCEGFCEDEISLKNHQFENYWEKFMCSFCTFTYFTTDALQEHLKESHPEQTFNDKDFKCKICDREFRAIKTFLAHIELTHNVICGECNDSFKLRTRLIEHFYEKHHPDYIKDNKEKRVKIPGLKNFKPICYVCERLFKNPFTLFQHLKRAHSEAEQKLQFKCSQCDIIFEDGDEADTHFKENHDDKKFECEICFKRFLALGQLKIHQKNTHSEKPKSRRRFVFGKCKECKFVATSNFGLLRHFNIEHPNVQLNVEYKCAFCQDFLKSPKQMNAHLKAEHPDSIKDARFTKEGKLILGRCNECSYVTSNRHNVLRHFEKMHQGLELNVEYKCSNCPENFKTFENVTEHTKSVHRVRVTRRTEVSQDKEMESECSIEVDQKEIVIKKEVENVERDDQNISVLKNPIKTEDFISEKCDDPGEKKLLFTNKTEDIKMKPSPSEELSAIPIQMISSNIQFVNTTLNEIPMPPLSKIGIPVPSPKLLKIHEIPTNLSQIAIPPLAKIGIQNPISSFSELGIPIPSNSSNPIVLKILKPETPSNQIIIPKIAIPSTSSKVIKISKPNNRKEIAKIAIKKVSKPIPSSSSKVLKTLKPKTPPKNTNLKPLLPKLIPKTSTSSNLRVLKPKSPSTPTPLIEIPKLPTIPTPKGLRLLKPKTPSMVTNLKAIPNPKLKEKTPKPAYAKCNICFAPLFRHNIYNHFQKKHNGQSIDAKYSCWNCDQYFDTLEDVKEHNRIVHNKCYICKVCFPYSYSLNRHFQNMHSNFLQNGEFKCTKCDKYFKTLEDIGQHLNIDHSNHEPKITEFKSEQKVTESPNDPSEVISFSIFEIENESEMETDVKVEKEE
ncbi:hypothetical protein ACFFRR_003471 [Megaselia abdita]